MTVPPPPPAAPIPTPLPATAPAALVAPPAAVPLRIRHIDSLRALAAWMVVWIHYAQLLAPKAAPDPSFLTWLGAFPRHIEIGQMGVMIFFAISGFVICRSFSGPREGGARRFLIRRFCRLYPAFWVSMAVGWLACQAVGIGWSGWALAANASMLPGTLGQPQLLGVYWTLEVELLFYGLCLGLYLLRSLERRALLAAIVLVLVWLQRVLHIINHHSGLHLDLPHGPRRLVLHLAIMFWGVLFRLAYDATGGFRRGVLRHGGTWLVAALLWELIDAPDPNLKRYMLGLYAGPIPAQSVLACAALIFTVWVAVLRVDNRVLTYFGVISYSLYLFHLVPVIIAEHLLAFEGSIWRQIPFWVDFLICSGLSVGVAALVYRWVEHPAIALGKRWVTQGRHASP